jgi:hypothetical protein
MPLETISGTGRASRREAGRTAASLGVARTWAKISATFWAPLSTCEGGEDGKEKIKGRPVAAEEKTVEADILSRNCQGTLRGRSSPGEMLIFAFCSPTRKYLSQPGLSRRFCDILQLKL